MEPIWSPEAWRWDPYALSACEAAGAQAGSGMASGITTAAVSDPAMSADAKAIAAIDKVVAEKVLNKPAKATKKGHKPSCQVAGCTSDLAHSRAYYRRYRICENHFRMPCMTIPTVLNGVVSRFCQQCAKFEPLTEFDSDKRSCRRQLNRHNERRKGRKGSSQKRTKQAEGGTGAGAADNSGEDDASGDSNSGRLVDGPLAELLRTSSIQRSGTGNGACDGEVFSGTGKAGSRPPVPADMQQMNIVKQHMGEQKQLEQMCQPQQQPSEAIQSKHVRDNTIDNKSAPAPTSAAEAEAAAGLAWPSAPHMQVGSPPVSRSEVTVEVGQGTRGRGAMDTEYDFDAVLAVAAQELLAHWQQEDVTITADAASPVTGVKAAPAPVPVEGSMDNALAGAVRAARLLLSCGSSSQLMPAGQIGAQPQPSNTSALFVKQLHPCGSAPVRSCLSLPQQRSNAPEPRSADSSVHGPAAPHLMPPPCDAQPGGGQDRVLEMLSQSQCFDMIRGDAHPLVQDAAAGPTFSWPQPLTTSSLLRSEGAPRQNAGMAMDPTRSSAPQTAGSHMSHPLQSPAPGQYPVIIPAAAMGREPAGLPSHVGNRQAWLNAHWANASTMSLNMQTEAALIQCAPAYPVAAPPPHDPVLWHMPVAATRGMEVASPGTSPPQVPLHPVLANLPTANDFQRNSNGQLFAPSSQPMLARHDQPQQQQQLPQQVHYPNIWSTPCPLPVSPPAPTVQYGSGAPGQPGMSLGRSGPSWMSTATPRSQSLGPNNLQRNSGGHSAVDGESGERLGTSNNTGTLAKNLGQAHYLLTEQSLTRLSIKLHGVTPDALPHDLRAALTEWLAATDVRLLQGFIRPGCVHLTLDCLVVNKKHSYSGSTMSAMASACPTPVRDLDDLLRAGLATAGVAHMASALPRPLARLFSSCTIVELQSPGKLVLMEGEAVWNVTSLDKRPNMPVVHSVQPLAILAGSHKPQALYLQGSHLEGRAGVSTSGSGGAQQPGSCQVLVRSHGRFFQTGPGTQVHSTSENGIVLPSSAINTGGASSSEASSSKTGWWRVGVDASTMQPGLAVVECQMGRTLSNWRPVLVVDDPGVLWEVLQLQPLQAQFPEHINSIVCDLALLLQLQSGVQAQAAAVQEVRVPAQVNNRVVEETDDDTSDLEDVNSLTAPSISDEDDDDDSVNNNEEEEARHIQEAGDAAGAGVRLHGGHAVATAIAVGGRRVNVTQHMVSWDSDTFQDVDTPNMHSSWGSTLNGGPLTAAIAAGTNTAVPMPVGSLGGTTDMDMARSFASQSGGDSSGSSDGASDAAAPTPAAAGTGGTSRPSAPARAAAAPVGAGLQADAISSAFSPEVRMSLAGRALRLLAFAADACWPCTTRLLLDLLTTLPLIPAAGAAAGQLVPIDCQTVLASTIGGEGFTLLHRAARSGSAATVKEVLSFSRSAGLVLNPAARGEAGVSALHLAAQSMEAGMSVALVLLTASRDAPLQWFVSRCADGLTPAQYAACQAGGPQVNEHARHLVQQLATYACGDRQSA